MLCTLGRVASKSRALRESPRIDLDLGSKDPTKINLNPPNAPDRNFSVSDHFYGISSGCMIVIAWSQTARLEDGNRFGTGNYAKDDNQAHAKPKDDMTTHTW